MRILITGGGGFIGSYLLYKLSAKHSIICLDHGKRYPELRDIINDNVELVEGDITDEVLLEKILQKDIDVVIHLAGVLGNNACIKNPIDAVKSHIYSTHLLVQKSLNHKVKQFIFSSTQSVYSTFKKREMPLTENMKLEPDDLYGILKMVSEYEIRDSDLNYTILRLANVFGHMKELKNFKIGGAIENFIQAARNGNDITIFGKGEQKIDYVNIEDVANCIENVLGNNSANNEIFNVGSGSLHSIEEIATIVSNFSEEFYQNKINIKKTPAPDGKIWPDRLMSIEKIVHKLDWNPSISIQTGIHDTMKNLGCLIGNT